jgi:pimeloyl-ACP methyl ester carboxylesterase
MPSVQASDGAEICYRAVGEGTPLILSTASFSSLLHWSGQEQALSRRYRLVTWDYRGHGHSEAPVEPERYSLAQVVDDLRAVHDAAAGGEPAFVGGLSIGGLVSLSYYLAHPERVRALLLFNTGPGFKNPEALAQWNEMLEKAATKMETVGLESYLAGRWAWIPRARRRAPCAPGSCPRACPGSRASRATWRAPCRTWWTACTRSRCPPWCWWAPRTRPSSGRPR